jgi:hypothetical protein
MIDHLADRWRDLIDRRDELLRLGQGEAARRVEEDVVHIRRRVASMLCRKIGRFGSATERGD